MITRPGGPVLNTFIEAFCKACNVVFTRSLASDWSFQPFEAAASEEDEKLVSLEVSQSGGNAKLAIELSQKDASKIIEIILGEPVPADEEISEDQVQIVQSVLDESCTAALSDARWELGREFPGAIATPDWEPAATFAVNGTDGESGTVVLRIGINSDVLAAITAAAEKSAVQASPKSAKSAATAESPAPSPAREAASEDNLGLVMDVELDLTLCFGRRQMTLKDILHLGPGSVVELDREVQEPVDLLLGDKVVARGEVVIVDGNYGLRVTEVVS